MICLMCRSEPPLKLIGNFFLHFLYPMYMPSDRIIIVFERPTLLAVEHFRLVWFDRVIRFYKTSG